MRAHKMHKIFINDFGRLRSGWRAVIFVFAFIASSLLLATVLRVFYLVALAVLPQLPRVNLVAELIFRLALLAAALVAGYLCARFLEGLPWRSLGLTFHRGWLRDLLVGFAIGFASIVAA